MSYLQSRRAFKLSLIIFRLKIPMYWIIREEKSMRAAKKTIKIRERTKENRLDRIDL